MPEEFLDILSLACRLPKESAKKAFKLCSEMYEGNDDREGDSASDSVLDVTEEDPSTYSDLVDEEDQQERRQNIINQTSRAENDERSDLPDVKVKKIVYKDSLNSTNLWSFRLDPEYGTILYINKSHPFYQLVLKSLPAADPKRQAIECFMYCLAVGEIKTKQNLRSVNFEDINQVMSRFNQVSSWNLQNWTTHNQDLFD